MSNIYICKLIVRIQYFLIEKGERMLNYYQYGGKGDSHRSHSLSSYGKKKVGNFSYSPSDRIGKGFSSVVYRGVNDQTNEPVAIKAIDMKGIKDSVSRQMLDCQIQALKTLSHNNVLRCFDVVKQPSYCYIITQYCNHGDLSQLLKKKRKLSESQTNRILKDIVSGFIEIGRKGFLHRDLKLANIFIHDGSAKIADFGFAKKNKFESQKEKYNVGSPLYMSPEALKKNIYSLKNDIWSIGIMTYELLYGTTPWQCRTEKQLIDKMTRIPIKFKESFNISSELKEFIKGCLEVDQKKRMSLKDLEDWLSQNGGRRAQEKSETMALGLRKQENLPKLNMSHKPNSQIEKLKPELSHRQSYSSHGDKQNTKGRISSSALPKNIIDKNNGLLVNEINTFRLLFKIYEKLKKLYQNEHDLLSVLGQQVLKRVIGLKKHCEEVVGDFGLISIERYFDEKTNPSIKKYKSVIREYYRKYHQEIKVGTTFSGSLKMVMKDFLQKKCISLKESDELLMGYWMIEYFKLSKETPKSELDAIIDPKLKISKSFIEQKVAQLR